MKHSPVLVFCGIRKRCVSRGHYMPHAVFVIENRDDGEIVIGPDPCVLIECVL